MVYSKIQKAEDDGSKIAIPEQKSMGQVVKPAMEQTLSEYDTGKWKEMMQQLVMGAVIISGMHYKWGYSMPLVMQVIMSPMQLIENPLFKIYVLGSPAVGDLKRPFPAPNPFGLPTPPADPAAAVEEEMEEVEANVHIDELIDGSSLGIQYSFKDLTVEKCSKEAKAFGWILGDRIVAVAGKKVKTSEEFAEALVEAKKSLPFDMGVVQKVAKPKQNVAKDAVAAAEGKKAK